MVDRDAPTPRQTGTWGLALAKTQAWIKRLERAIPAKASNSPFWYDPTGHYQATRMKEHLESLAPHFIAWRTDKALEARENDELQARLKEIGAAVETLLGAMPPKNGKPF
jgi:hypothetical protein